MDCHPVTIGHDKGDCQWSSRSQLCSRTRASPRGHNFSPPVRCGNGGFVGNLQQAEHEGAISSFTGVSALQRLLIYADDVALFVKPTTRDLNFVRAALDIFGEASGLRINYRKSDAIIIRGSEVDSNRVTGILKCTMGSFPCKYIGIQLAISKLTKPDWQPLLDQVRHMVPSWQRGLIQRPGRLILVKSVIAARSIHQLLILDAPQWVFDDINSWLQSFFWAGKDKSNGGQCLVSWNTICLPHCYGGLGVKNLKLQALSLRVRWEWLRRTDDERPWQGLKLVPDIEAREVFNSLVSISVGDGKKKLFWRDHWINGRAVADIALSILAIVPTRTQNMRMVHQAFGSRRWERDVPEELNFTMHMQLYPLQQAISLVEVQDFYVVGLAVESLDLGLPGTPWIAGQDLSLFHLSSTGG